MYLGKISRRPNGREETASSVNNKYSAVVPETIYLYHFALMSDHNRIEG